MWIITSFLIVTLIISSTLGKSIISFRQEIKETIEILKIEQSNDLLQFKFNKDDIVIVENPNKMIIDQVPNMCEPNSEPLPFSTKTNYFACGKHEHDFSVRIKTTLKDLKINLNYNNLFLNVVPHTVWNDGKFEISCDYENLYDYIYIQTTNKPFICVDGFNHECSQTDTEEYICPCHFGKICGSIDYDKPFALIKKID
jgi:hypothetical protein